MVFSSVQSSESLPRRLLPRGFTFVDAHVCPRSADVRSLATALHATVGLSNLRAILQAERQRNRRAATQQIGPTAAIQHLESHDD